MNKKSCKNCMGVMVNQSLAKGNKLSKTTSKQNNWLKDYYHYQPNT